jgi:hypothetical protein
MRWINYEDIGHKIYFFSAFAGLRRTKPHYVTADKPSYAGSTDKIHLITTTADKASLWKWYGGARPTYSNALVGKALPTQMLRRAKPQSSPGQDSLTYS